MKIAIDARNLTVRQSGIGRYIVESARHLIAAGGEVTLYLPEPPDPSFGSLDGFAMRIARAEGSVGRILWGQTVLPWQVSQDGADVLWGPAHRLPRHLPRKIPTVLTVLDLVWIHAAHTMRWRTWTGERLLMAPAVRAADIVVAISDATAEDVLTRFNLDAERVLTVHPGATPLPASPDDVILTRHRLRAGRYALFVGTLEPRKNLSLLLEAFALLPAETRRRCRLVLVGGKGWRMGDLSKLIAERGLEDDVVLIGYASEADLGRLYEGARFVAMPSLYEGFGLPLVEANAFGVPTLTSDRSSMPEVAGLAGLLIDPDDPRSIASGFDKLVADDALHTKLASAAKANAARFQWSDSATKLIRAFEAAVEHSRRSGNMRALR